MKNQKKLFVILLWASIAGILLVMSIIGAARELDLSGPFWAYAGRRPSASSAVCC